MLKILGKIRAMVQGQASVHRSFTSLIASKMQWLSICTLTTEKLQHQMLPQAILLALKLVSELPLYQQATLPSVSSYQQV